MSDLISTIAASARAEANLLLRRGSAWLVGVALLLFAAGLGLAAGVVASIDHLGIAGALGLWAAVTFLVAAGVLMLANRDVDTTDRRTRAVGADGAKQGGAKQGGTEQSGAAQQAYQLGERIGHSMPPLALAGIALAVGILATRAPRAPSDADRSR